MNLDHKEYTLAYIEVEQIWRNIINSSVVDRTVDFRILQDNISRKDPL